jgi:hypothetical protein
MPILLSTPMPKYFLNYLTTFNNVTVQDGEIPLIELVNSPEACSAFIDFTNGVEDDKNNNILLYPTFGHPLEPYINPLEQIEVFNLLATYESLLIPDLIANIFPYINAKFPIMGGFQYYKTKLVIQAVKDQIQNPTYFIDKCTGLCAIPNGNTICDLSITYANAVIVIRIKRQVI